MDTGKGTGELPGQDTLPPLIEKLPPGPNGVAEYVRLVEELLRPLDVHRAPGGDAGRSVHAISFTYPAPHVQAEVEHLDGFEGPVFFVAAWSAGPLETDLGAELEQVLGTLRPINLPGGEDVRAPARKTLVLVIPRDPTAVEERWLSSRKVPPGWTLRAWGPSRLVPLFHQHLSLFARYYPERARVLLDGYDGADLRDLARRYREKVALAHQHLRLLGFPPEILREREARSEIHLGEIFVPLRLLPDESNAQPIDLREVLQRDASVVILGDPGMGKSTLLAFIALLCVGGAELAGLSPSARALPLFISLRDFARVQQQRGELSFLDYLTHRARTDLSLASAHPALFEGALRLGEAVVLLDGLDEVGNAAARHRVAAAVRAFRAEYPRSSFWITSRLHGYTPDVALPREGFRHLRIEPLEDAQVEDFLRRWYAIHVPNNPREQAERQGSLRRAVFRTPSVRLLAGSPLLLTLMAFIHRVLGDLPQDRCELYGRCVDMLLRSWQEARQGQGEALARHPFEEIGLRPHVQKDYLAHLALALQERTPSEGGDSARGLVPRHEALEHLTARHFERASRERPSLTEAEADAEMSDFLDYLGDRTGLVVDRGNGLLSFLHLSFQEYLAAWAFTCDPGAPDREQPSFFTRHLGNPAWQEVLLLRLYIVLREQGGGGERAFDTIVAAIFRELERKDIADGWLLLCRVVRDGLEIRASDRQEILRRSLAFWVETPRFGGRWLAALEEIRLFAEQPAAALRELLAEKQRTALPVEAVAYLHLEARLFGVPAAAAARFRARADLPEMLADLVVFFHEPAFAELLAGNARVEDWDAAFAVIGSAALYRLTVGWATGAVLCPVEGEAPLVAAARWIRRRLALEVRSRVVFAERHPGGEAASLFRAPGRLCFRHRFDEVEVPVSAWVVPQGSASAEDPGAPERRLLQADLARSHAQAEAFPEDAVVEPFSRWTCAVVQQQLEPFTEGTSVGDERVLRFARAFARAVVRSGSNEFTQLMMLQMGNPVENLLKWEDAATAPLRDLVVTLDRDWSRSTFEGVMDRFVNRTILSPATFVMHDPDNGMVSGFVNDLGPLFVSSHGRDFLRGLGLESGSWGAGGIMLPLLIPGRAPITPAELADPGNLLDLMRHREFWAYAHAAAKQSSSVHVGPTTTALRFDLRNPLSTPMLLYGLTATMFINRLLHLARHLAVLTPDGGAPLDEYTEWLSQHPIDVYPVAIAWEEHARVLQEKRGRLAAAAGALALAHAEYASLMTGLDLEGPLWAHLVTERDLRVDVVLSEHERAASPEQHSAQPPAPAAPAPSPAPALPPEPPAPLFTWLHLSDIHFGHPSAGHRWDQMLVITALGEDLTRLRAEGIPAPDVVLVTGDIAWSGAAAEYEQALTWLGGLVERLGLDLGRVFVVPGNHDVDRSADRDRAVWRLVRNLREGSDQLDEVLDHPEDRARLLTRQRHYLNFAARLAAARAGSRDEGTDVPYWVHTREVGGGLRIRLVGLNTALLAADDADREHLCVGKQQLAKTLAQPPPEEGEIVVVLGHHPFEDRWLTDQRDADGWVRRHAHVHLAGHVHEASIEELRGGGPRGVVRVVAGAAHGGPDPGVPASHGYAIGAVYPGDASEPVLLRVHPRRFSDRQKDFLLDVENVPRGRTYAEHSLPRVRLPGAKSHRR